MSFAAKYSGWCNSADCDYGDARIREGDEVDWFDNMLMHVSCAKRAQRQEPPLCPACWQYHRGECA